MLEPLPLRDKKVLVPRGVGQAKSLSYLVEKVGGIPIEIPLIAFRPTKTNQRLQSFLQSIDTYDWIIFTSNVTVETFFSFMDASKIDSFPKVAVIGKKTEEFLLERGVKSEFVPSAYVAEVFVEEFLPIVESGSRVLIPKGNLAREHISSSLLKNGIHADEIIIYETYMPEESKEMLAKIIVKDELDILVFTSPSTVDHFMNVVNEYQLKDHLKDCVVGCIGPITEKKLHDHGFTVHASPKEYTVSEMMKSTIKYFEKNSIQNDSGGK